MASPLELEQYRLVSQTVDHYQQMIGGFERLYLMGGGAIYFFIFVLIGSGATFSAVATLFLIAALLPLLLTVLLGLRVFHYGKRASQAVRFLAAIETRNGLEGGWNQRRADRRAQLPTSLILWLSTLALEALITAVLLTDQQIQKIVGS